MGSTNQVFQSNPYADFDPSQYSNPYSPFPSSALPFPSQYMGWPTDAMGNPIQMPAGMTLNQTPAQPQQAPAAAAAAQGPGFNMATTSEGMPSGQTNLGRGVTGQQWLSAGNQVANADKGSFGGWSPTGQLLPGQQQQGQPQQAAPAVNNVGLTPQQYLQLKANPGPVSNPGATVPQAASTAGGPGVLQHFLANWNPAAGGPGAGFQQGFAKSLKGLGY